MSSLPKEQQMQLIALRGVVASLPEDMRVATVETTKNIVAAMGNEVERLVTACPNPELADVYARAGVVAIAASIAMLEFAEKHETV